jgi:hypothetical protein
VTASFGVARLGAGESGADLLQRVDQLLYEAKVQGRNRVVAGGENEAAPLSRRASRGRQAAAAG